MVVTVIPDSHAVPGPRPAAGAAVLDIVVPVHNEQADLETCLRRLHAHLSERFPYPFRITVADNASTDDTLAVARRLADELPVVHVLHLDAKGRGRALREAWSASSAPVLAYLDADLSTDLAALLPLVAPLISGHSDLAIGSRLARGSRVVRGAKREVISRGYNLLLRGTLAVRFSDAQCGFKAIRKDAAEWLLPLVQDTGWFFDTELLVLAQRAGLRIHEVPVDWVDDPDSRVDLVATALADLRGIARLARALAGGSLPLAELRGGLGRDPLPRPDRVLAGRRTRRAGTAGTPAGVPAGLPRQLLRFAAIGVVSTVAYLLLYSLLRTGTGAQPANAAALLITAVANTAANRRLTFGIRGRQHAVRHQAQGLFAFALGLALTAGCLATLHALYSAAGRGVELSVLVVANLVATLMRFLILRGWMYHRRAGATAHPRPASRRPAGRRDAPTGFDHAEGATWARPARTVWAVAVPEETMSDHHRQRHGKDTHGKDPHGKDTHGKDTHGKDPHGKDTKDARDARARRGHRADGHRPERDAGRPAETGPADATLLAGRRLRRRLYVEELLRLQAELVKMQEWVRSEGARLVVLFEGRDAAGKGSAIKRVAQFLNPRVARIVALPAPTERQRSQWYFQRYTEHLPANGEIVLFDRSWYNRAGVERVMGFCTESEYHRFLHQCPTFERLLIEDGIMLRKYWFSVSDAEQQRRFQSRLDDPMRHWKLSPMDLESITRWEDYSRAKDEMFAATDLVETPWYDVESDDKRRSRINMIAHLLSTVPYYEVSRPPLRLPPRPERTTYLRPPRDNQRHVPDHAATLVDDPG